MAATKRVDTSPRVPVRREQLLDAAARLVGERGLLAFTMEGVAAEAGVSKALPYRHFSNAEGVLVALYRRELARLADAILGAVAGIEGGDEILTAAVRAYFDEVADRGDLLNALAGAGSPVPEMADGAPRPAPRLVIELLRRGYGLGGKQAIVLATIVTGLVTAGSDSLGRGEAARSTVERITIAAAVGAVRAVVGGP